MHAPVSNNLAFGGGRQRAGQGPLSLLFLGSTASRGLATTKRALGPAHVQPRPTLWSRPALASSGPGPQPARGPAPRILFPGAPSPPPARPGGWAPGRLYRPVAVTRRPWPGGTNGDPPTARRRKRRGLCSVRGRERTLCPRASRRDVGFRGQDRGECGVEPGRAGSGRGGRAESRARHAAAPEWRNRPWRRRGPWPPARPAATGVGSAGGLTLLGRGGD